MILSILFFAACVACFGIGLGLGLMIATFSIVDDLKYGFAPAADGATSKEN